MVEGVAVENHDIIYEDADILVVDKAAGLLTVADRYSANAPYLRRNLEERFGNVLVVHRLDKDTSGVMVFARNAEAHANLSRQFENRESVRCYHVLVEGTVSVDSMEIAYPLAEDTRRPGRIRVSEKGKEAITSLRVIQRFREATIVECLLVTGRQHQIRVHCAAIGHPLVVDALYGRASAIYLSSLKKNYRHKGNVEPPLLDRLSMHSRKLSFCHPRFAELRTFEAEYPKDFAILLKALEKYGGRTKEVL